MRKNLRVLALVALATAVAETAIADGAARPDAHAPIGVMGDHMHKTGEVMVSYRYVRMNMHGNRDGTTNFSPNDVFDEGFTVTPTEMDIEMHVFGAMYAPRDWLTLTTMLPIVRKSMDHIANTPMGRVRFTTRSNGVGDLKLGGLVRLFDNEAHHVHGNVGFSIPTGTTNARDNNPASMGREVTLPYPMQLGSGTVDFLPGLTYTGELGAWSWGGQGLATLRIGNNDDGYRFGNRIHVTGWGARKLADWISSSLRLEYQNWGNIHGDDSALPPRSFIPTADPNRRAGERLDGGIGFNFIVTDGAFKDVRFATEVLLPLWQNLDGPQLEADYRVVAGVQYAF